MEDEMTAIDAKPGEDFIEELEDIRDSWTGEDRSARGARSREQAADARRKSLRGSSNNHAFTGEQYLNCTDKSLRRIHLQKIMDESGQTNFRGAPRSRKPLNQPFSQISSDQQQDCHGNDR